MIGVLLLAAAGAAFAAPQAMSVQVKEVQARATPSFLGKVVGTLAYGDRVSVLETRSGWARVSLPSGKGEGWVNLTALTEKTVVLKSGQNVEQTASSGEVSLAGKGFNSQVEAQYKEEQKLDYTPVDAMEKMSVSPAELSAFIAQGGLTEEGGAE